MSFLKWLFSDKSQSYKLEQVEEEEVTQEPETEKPTPPRKKKKQAPVRRARPHFNNHH